MMLQPENNTPYGVVYLIRNTVNGKVYVGQTRRDLPVRWKGHLQEARAVTNGKVRAICQALQEFGGSAFSIEQIDVASSNEELNEKERFHIARLSSCNPAIGYNRAPGGYCGVEAKRVLESLRKPKTEEHRRHLSEAKKGCSTAHMNTPECRKKKSESLCGRTFSEESRRKMSEARIGVHPSIETRAKRSERMSGSGNPMAGVPMSAGHQNKMQKAAAEWRDANPEAPAESARKASNARWTAHPEQREQLRQRMTGAGSPQFGKPLSDEQKQKMVAGTLRRLASLGPEGRSALARHAASMRPKVKCSICGDPQRGHGFCNKHYLRWKKYGDPNYLQTVVKSQCYACDQLAVAKGFCLKHYMQDRRAAAKAERRANA